MPRGVALEATYQTRHPGGALTATMASTATPTGYLEATATVDRSALLGLSQRVRYVGIKCLMGGLPLKTLRGSVTIHDDIDSLLRTATLEISDPRVAYEAVGSLSDGDKDLILDVLTRYQGAKATWRAFVGKTEAAPNQGNYRPVGQFRAVGTAGPWFTARGCMLGFGANGKTRGEWLAEFAAEIGVNIQGLSSLTKSGLVTKPVDFNGTLPELIKQWGEIEGWHARANDDDSLEILTDDALLTGPPVYEFTDGSDGRPANVYSYSEEPPSRPTTKWTLTTTVLVPDCIAAPGQKTVVITDGGFDDAGQPWKTVTEVTTDQGVELLRRVTEWYTFQRDGVTPGPLVLQPRRITEIATEWVKAEMTVGDASSLRYTTKYRRRTVTTRELGGTQASKDNGAGRDWAGGGRFLETVATMRVIEEQVIVPAWAQEGCILESVLATKKQWYAQLDDPALTTTHEYADGSFRFGQAYVYQVFSQEKIRWSDYRFSGVAPEVLYADEFDDFHVIAATTAGDPIEAYGASQLLTKRWKGNESNTKHEYTEILSALGIHFGRSTDATTPLKTIGPELRDGPVPGPPIGSDQVPQLQQMVVSHIYDITPDVDYVELAGADTIPAAEGEEELRSVAMRRFRDALSVGVPTRHPLVPALRVGDRVTVTDRKRNRYRMPGYIAKIDRTIQLLNGKADQITHITVPPRLRLV